MLNQSVQKLWQYNRVSQEKPGYPKKPPINLSPWLRDEMILPAIQ